MTNTGNFAATELEILFKNSPADDRPLIEPFRYEILALCEKFGQNGESGGSAPYTAAAITGALKRLLLQKPIAPITGIDEEWVDQTEANGGETLYQNKRCSALFKDGAGKCWYLDAIHFKVMGLELTTSSALLWNKEEIKSRQFIKGFPFTPKTFYIDVHALVGTGIDTQFMIYDPAQLAKVWEYYQKPSNIEQNVTHYRCTNAIKSNGKTINYGDLITAEQYNMVRPHDKKWFIPEARPINSKK